MTGVIEARGYSCQVLHSDYKDMNGELDVLLRLTSFATASGLIIDSYYATNQYLSILSGEKKTAYIDDYPVNRPVNAIINYNIYADKSEYSNGIGSPGQKLILGPGFAPLRREFQNLKASEIKDKAKEILFLAGGSDPEHAALNFAGETASHEDSLHYVIVTGAMSGDHQAVKEIADRSAGRIEVRNNVTEMRELMCASDMAVSAAGSTLYELCACHVPVINYVLADNQRLVAEGFADKGAMIFAGDVRKDTSFYSRLYTLIKELSSDKEKRTQLSQKAGELVDGSGAKRLIQELNGVLF